MKEYDRHFEQTVQVNAGAEAVFGYADDHRNLVPHMEDPSLTMAGGNIRIETDIGSGKRVGSHIRVSGALMGVELKLDEVVTVHDPFKKKEWKTVGDVNLIVLDRYRLGFEITPRGQESDFRVYIDYDLPKSLKTRLVGRMFGGMYAKWCVGQMANGTREHFLS